MRRGYRLQAVRERWKFGIRNWDFGIRKAESGKRKKLGGCGSKTYES